MSRNALSVEKFLEYIMQTFDVRAENISPLSSISSNDLFKITDGDKRYIIKNYKSSYLFDSELITLLGYKGKIKIPEIMYYEEKAQNGWDWMMYKYVDGDSLFEVKEQLEVTDFYDIFFDVGSELRKFHDVKIGYQPTKKERSNFIKQIIQKTELNYSCLGENKNAALFQRTIHFLRNHYPLLDKQGSYSLVIKDFTDKHIIIDKKEQTWTLTGIIDFEQVVYSNRFIDFVFLYINYLLRNSQMECSFLKGYNKQINDEEKCLIAFFIFQYALELCGILRNIHFSNEEQGRIIILQTFEWLEKQNIKLFFHSTP